MNDPHQVIPENLPTAHCDEQGACAPGDEQCPERKLVDIACLRALRRFHFTRQMLGLREFNLATASTMSRLRQSGALGLPQRQLTLLAGREFIPIVAVIRDLPIRTAIRDSKPDLRKRVTDIVDETLRAKEGWRWADPAEWNFESLFSNRAAKSDIRLKDLVLSRAACILHYQAKGLKSSGGSPGEFASLLDQLEQAHDPRRAPDMPEFIPGGRGAAN